ncbi:MAG: sigma-70 family RNA polymerase sigma factor [Planctomycetota bacterium]
MRDPDLEQLSGAGEQRGQIFERLLESYRPRLRRMIGLRLDRRVRTRVDESDVMQDAFVEVTRRLESFLERPEMPFFVWVRFIAVERVIQLHRKHLGAEGRTVDREFRLSPRNQLEATSEAIVARLISAEPSPSSVAMNEEARARVVDAIEEMDPMDREVLALRHFEQLTNGEVAEVLGLSIGTASKRYLRALDRLRSVLAPTLRDESDGGATP